MRGAGGLELHLVPLERGAPPAVTGVTGVTGLTGETGETGAVDPACRERCLRAAAQALLALLPGDAAAWSAVDLATGSAEVVTCPEPAGPGADPARRLREAVGDHPVVRSCLRVPVGTVGAPRRLNGPSPVSRLLVIPTAHASATTASWWEVQRVGGDFTDREGDVAAALQPVLVVLDRLVGRVPAAAAPPPEEDAGRGLTSREVEVLRRVSTGVTAAAIARAMGISSRTVRKHLENAYRKLGCHDRLLAVQRAYDLHVLPPPAALPPRVR